MVKRVTGIVEGGKERRQVGGGDRYGKGQVSEWGCTGEASLP